MRRAADNDAERSQSGAITGQSSNVGGPNTGRRDGLRPAFRKRVRSDSDTLMTAALPRRMPVIGALVTIATVPPIETFMFKAIL
jgi:hypothetical protein